MSALSFRITIFSLLVLLASGAYYFFRSKNVRRFLLQLLIPVLCFLCIYSLFFTPETPTAKGDSANAIYFVIVLCFLCGWGCWRSILIPDGNSPKKSVQNLNGDSSWRRFLRHQSFYAAAFGFIKCEYRFEQSCHHQNDGLFDDRYCGCTNVEIPESGGKGKGIFTRALPDALEQGLADTGKDGFITVDEI